MKFKYSSQRRPLQKGPVLRGESLSDADTRARHIPGHYVRVGLVSGVVWEGGAEVSGSVGPGSQYKDFLHTG